MSRTHEARRALRLIGYAMFVAAGPFAVLFTPPVMAESVPEWVADTWGWYVMAGALGCLWGTATDRWMGEYLFLHLLGSATALYAACAFASSEQDLGRIVSGLLVGVTTLLLLDRWLDVRAIAKVAAGGDPSSGQE